MERMMKKLQIFGLIMMMICGAVNTHWAGAQTYVAPAVTISKDKVKLDGKVFYSHIVLEKQTLFSISKAYNVSIDEIYRYNPSVKENGLRKNDIIIIPAVPQETAQQKQEVAQSKKETVQVKQEVVQPKQKVYDYQQSVNPVEETRYTVSWYDDLSSIAAKFNVSEEAIMAANNLTGRKLKNRQVLIIPAPGTEVSELVKAEEQPVEETVVNTEPEQPKQRRVREVVIKEEADEDIWNLFTESPTQQTPSVQSEEDINRPKVIVSLVLPFKANGEGGSKNNLDFYSGALMAARDLTDNGIDIQLNAFDIANDTVRIDTYALRASDVIIGPVSTQDINKVLSMTGSTRPLVSPLDQKAESLVARNRNHIQAPTTQSAQFNDLANWIKEDLQENDKVIVISEKGARSSDMGKTLIATINANGVDYIPFTYSILEGRDIQHLLESKMTHDGVNRVVIASESEAFVNDAVRNINLTILKKYDVILYAPSKIRSFETIEIENLHNLSLHTSLSYNIDYQDESTREFLGKYRAMFGTEPTQFAFQGYDLTKYFTELIAKYQASWMAYLSEADAEMLQSKLSFWSNGTGGYVNVGTRRIIYGKGYSIIAAEPSHSQQPEE